MHNVYIQIYLSMYIIYIYLSIYIFYITENMCSLENNHSKIFFIYPFINLCQMWKNIEPYKNAFIENYFSHVLTIKITASLLKTGNPPPPLKKNIE